jgi:hypothetical protein
MVDMIIAERPRFVAWLGYGGLIPFVALAVLSWFDAERVGLWHANLRIYSAVILSFVGALHWGFAMLLSDIPSGRRDALFAWSVVPALLAFFALTMPIVPGDLLLAAGFIAHYAQDRRIAAALPAWYLPMRFRLSTIAIVCIATGACAAVR